jgi:hypothetical protein
MEVLSGYNACQKLQFSRVSKHQTGDFIMKKLLLSLTVLAVLMVANSVQAAPPLQEPVREPYFIEPGETVGAISEDIFGDPLYYPVVVAYNNGYAACDPSVPFITDANRVTAGQEIMIPDSTIFSVTGTNDPYGSRLPGLPITGCGDTLPDGDLDFSILSGIIGRQWTLTEYYDAQNGYQDVSGSSYVTLIFTI